MTKLLIFSLLICWIISYSYSSDQITNVLQKMTVDERLYLDYFFRELILNEGGGYVLSGAKPAAIGMCGFPELRSTTFFGSRFFNKNLCMEKGHEVWKKYEKFFPMKRYLLVCTQNREDDLLSIIFIHKEALQRVFIENLPDFQLILGKEVTYEAVLQKIAKGKQSLYDALGEHSVLEGIVLGFGRHNSWLFYQRDLLSNRNFDYLIIPRKIDSMQIEIEKIDERLRSLPSRETRLNLAKPISFFFDPDHEETKKINQKYIETRREITHFYSGEDFLEVTLRKLTS